MKDARKRMPGRINKKEGKTFLKRREGVVKIGTEE